MYKRQHLDKELNGATTFRRRENNLTPSFANIVGSWKEINSVSARYSAGLLYCHQACVDTRLAALGKCLQNQHRYNGKVHTKVPWQCTVVCHQQRHLYSDLDVTSVSETIAQFSERYVKPFKDHTDPLVTNQVDDSLRIRRSNLTFPLKLLRL